MSEPQIKGVLLIPSLKRICELVEFGKVSKEAAQAAFPDIDFTTSKRARNTYSVSGWYPVEDGAALLRFLLEHDGKGDPDHLENWGLTIADAVRATGIYKQMEFAAKGGARLWKGISSALGMGGEKERIQTEDAMEASKLARMMLPMYKLFFSFGNATSDPIWQDDHWVGFYLEVKGAGPMPDEVIACGRGFLKSFGETIAGEPVIVMSDRPTPERVVFGAKTVSSGDFK